jgi:hypothetical protein
MPNPATIADIEARWKPLSDQQVTNASAYLDDAWWMLLGRRPNLETDISEGTVTAGNVIRVVSAMVLRILKNPEGKASEQIDDYKYTRHELIAQGLLSVTSDELADITPGRRRRRSIRLVKDGDE